MYSFYSSSQELSFSFRETFEKFNYTSSFFYESKQMRCPISCVTFARVSGSAVTKTTLAHNRVLRFRCTTRHAKRKKDFGRLIGQHVSSHDRHGETANREDHLVETVRALFHQRTRGGGGGRRRRRRIRLRGLAVTTQ